MPLPLSTFVVGGRVERFELSPIASLCLVCRLVVPRIKISVQIIVTLSMLLLRSLLSSPSWSD